MPDITKATSATIIYHSGGRRVEYSLADEEMRELITSWQAKSFTPNSAHAAPTLCAVDFFFPDRKIRVQLVSLRGFEPDLAVDVHGWGTAVVDRKFFVNVTELASKHAGRSVDVLKEN